MSEYQQWPTTRPYLEPLQSSRIAPYQNSQNIPFPLNDYLKQQSWNSNSSTVSNQNAFIQHQPFPLQSYLRGQQQYPVEILQAQSTSDNYQPRPALNPQGKRGELDLIPAVTHPKNKREMLSYADSSYNYNYSNNKQPANRQVDPNNLPNSRGKIKMFRLFNYLTLIKNY